MNFGSCMCGLVKFEVNCKLEKADACHCVQCRKWTGHFLPSVEVKRSDLILLGEENIKWHHSSDKVRRGFCGECGSSLFFDPLDQSKHDWIAVALGAFDEKTQVKLGMHIFVSEKGDYYQLNDGVKQNER